MEVKEEPCKLASVDSILACVILNDLEHHLKLCKLASIKSEEISCATERKTVSVFGDFGVGLCGEFGGIKVPDDTALESRLEYLQLSGTICPQLGASDRVEDKPQLTQGMDYIIDVVRKTNKSLRDKSSFSILRDEVTKTSQYLNRESILKSNIEEAQQRISVTKEEFRRAKQEASLEEQLKTGQIAFLKDQHHLIGCEERESMKFANMYFDAQSCNMSCNHRNEMDKKTKEILQVKGQIDRDIHCLAVMESWTEDFCQQVELKIDEWKLKFRRDEFAMEMRIEAKQRAIKAQEELIKSLNETIAERLEELAPWEEEKEVERQERLAHMRRYYSARKIQRWWRAYMIKWKLYKRKRIKPKV